MERGIEIKITDRFSLASFLVLFQHLKKSCFVYNYNFVLSFTSTRNRWPVQLPQSFPVKCPPQKKKKLTKIFNNQTHVPLLIFWADSKLPAKKGGGVDLGSCSVVPDNNIIYNELPPSF